MHFQIHNVGIGPFLKIPKCNSDHSLKQLFAEISVVYTCTNVSYDTVVDGKRNLTLVKVN